MTDKKYQRIIKIVALCNLVSKGVEKMINTLKIKGRMVELSLKQSDVAKSLGVSLPTVSQKLNNKRPMYLEEVAQLAKLLNVSDEEFHLYFFNQNVAYRNDMKEKNKEVCQQ